MRRLLIIGAGGFGREVLKWALDIQDTQNDWGIGGFLDNSVDPLRDYPCGFPVLGDAQSFSPGENDVFTCAIGDPIARLRICRSLRERGASFATLIHPTAIIGPRCSLGEGCILCPYTLLTTDVTVGDFVIFNGSSGAGHDAVIGSGCTISPLCAVTGFARLGEGVFLGSHVAVLPHAVVGDYARVGAGSVVLREVKPRTTVMGMPARVVFELDEPGHMPESR